MLEWHGKTILWTPPEFHGQTLAPVWADMKSWVGRHWLDLDLRGKLIVEELPHNE